MSHNPSFDLAARADLAACRAALREGSYTFYAASMVLPAGVREPARLRAMQDIG